MTTEKFNAIKKGCDYLIENFEHFRDNREGIEFTENKDDYEDFEELLFYFPGEEDHITIHVDNFIRLSEEFSSIKVINKGRIKTKSMSFQLVGTKDLEEEQILRHYHDFSLTLDNGIEINLIDEPFIVGLAAIQMNAYDNDYWGSITPYIAIEIDYGNEENVLSAEEEEDLIKSYLFEIADSSGIALRYSEINDFDYDYHEWEKEMEAKAVENLRRLEPYNEGMQLFVSAIQIDEPELKLLNFYKILEHFAPVIVNIEGNELMRKKLDLSQTKILDGDFIRSIFDLAKVYDEKFRDEDLIKSTFNVSFDFVGLFQYLPDSIQKKIKKQVGFEELTYKTEDNKILTACNMVGKILYSTRNRVVHSKSNYSTTGNECPTDDLNQLNEFLKHAASQTIRWYNRLPEHQKIQKIK